MICSKCGREYFLLINRVDNKTEICPVFGCVSVLSEEAQKRIIADVEKAEIEQGRVKQLLKPINASVS